MWHRLNDWLRPLWTFSSKLPLGELGERAAVRYLRRKKYVVVDRNVSFREGEIDIVAVDGRTVVFVEVKTRRSTAKGDPSEAVDRNKQHKIIDAASIYLNREDLLDQSTRFDIVSVVWSDQRNKPDIEHLIGAFDESRV